MSETLVNVFNFRTLIAILLGFGVASLLGPLIIPILHKLKFGQYIRKDGPTSHLKKAGTPTIGGIIFIFATLIGTIIMTKGIGDEAMIALYSFIGFGFVGFLDDILKIIHTDNLGLKADQKMILLLIISLALSYYGYKSGAIGSKILIPFININFDLGVFYIPFVVFYFLAYTNAVNLTDGLDGLSTSVTILVLTFFALISYGMAHYSLSIFCFILVGALLGFLRYNAFPARVFMGDTGSLALGGAVAAVAMILKLELLSAIVGGIYVMETSSVILQVSSFKLTGKRIFKMAPIHHHFEKCGWSETKIVTIFSITTVVLCIISFFSF